jgi:hypothetical protein
VTNQLHANLARAHVDDLLRTAAEERLAGAHRPPRRRLAGVLVRHPALASRRLPRIARPAPYH